MEKYLIEEYDVFEDKKWLKDESDIEGYFKDNGQDWLECGQGYAQDEADIICKIEDKFYSVHIRAELGSSKQEYGDRLYWIEDISSVKYKEIEKPKPKEKIEVVYKLHLTNEQKKILEGYMKKLCIEF